MQVAVIVAAFLWRTLGDRGSVRLGTRAGGLQRGASVSRRRARRKLGAATLAVGLIAVAACTDLSLVRRTTDDTVSIGDHAGFRFASAPLAGGPGPATPARDIDAAVREAIAGALAAKGYAPAPAQESRALMVDYTVRDVGGVNAQRLDSPSDYQRSWRRGGVDDGTGSMDHTVADAAFFRELSVTVLLIAPATGHSAWEGTARQSFPGSLPAGRRLQAVLRTMIDELLAPIAPQQRPDLSNADIAS